MNWTELPLALETLKTLADGDMDFALELLKIYNNDCLPYVQSIRQGIAERDYDRIYEAAHYLVGSSSNVGATQIRDCSQQLETLSRSREPGDYTALLEQIEAQFETIRLGLLSEGA